MVKTKRTKDEERERKRKYRQTRTAEKIRLDKEKDKARKKSERACRKRLIKCQAGKEPILKRGKEKSSTDKTGQ